MLKVVMPGVTSRMTSVDGSKDISGSKNKGGAGESVYEKKTLLCGVINYTVVELVAEFIFLGCLTQLIPFSTLYLQGWGREAEIWRPRSYQ